MTWDYYELKKEDSKGKCKVKVCFATSCKHNTADSSEKKGFCKLNTVNIDKRGKCMMFKEKDGKEEKPESFKDLMSQMGKTPFDAMNLRSEERRVVKE